MTKYIVDAETHYQDGHERHQYVFDTLQEALDHINKYYVNKEYPTDRTDYQLFECCNVKQIKLETLTEEIPQPPIVKKRAVVKK